MLNVGLTAKLGKGSVKYVLTVAQRDHSGEEYVATEVLELAMPEAEAKAQYNKSVEAVKKTRDVRGLAPTKTHGFRLPTRWVFLTDAVGNIVAEETILGTRDSGVGWE
jgi:hypothetical protein